MIIPTMKQNVKNYTRSYFNYFRNYIKKRKSRDDYIEFNYFL